MTDTKTTTTATGSKPKYKVGDLLKIPCHSGHYMATVTKVYKDLEDAKTQYERSFATILQSPRGKAEPDQPFYFCTVANGERKHVGVAEEHATLKRSGK